MTRAKNTLAVKITATALAAAFLAAECAQAAPVDPLPLVGVRIPQEILAREPSRFESPVEFASLKEIHHGDGERLIIHIQDAHSNLSGQQNLAGALDYLLGKYDLKLILSEGGSSDCSLTPFRKLAPKKIWKTVAKKYLVQGLISGEEYLNLVSEHPMKIVGVEDIALYKRSVENYSKLALQRREILEYLGRVRSALETLKKNQYTEDLLEYEKRKTAAGDGGEASFKALVELAGTRRADLSAYPNVKAIVELQESEGRIDFDRANLEQAALVDELVTRGASNELRAETEKMRRLKDAKLSQYAYLQKVWAIAGEKGVSLGRYSQLEGYLGYLRRFSEVDLDKTLDELRAVEDAIYLDALGSPDQRRVRAIDRYTSLLLNAYNIRMSADEFQSFLANEPDFSTVAYLSFMNAKLAALGYFEQIVPQTPVLENGKTALEDFYDSVQKRDFAFLENTEKALRSEGQKTAVLITGGYHTSHLKKLFAARGYSFAVLTPIVTAETNQQKYEKLLLDPFIKQASAVRTVQGESRSGYKSLAMLDDVKLPTKSSDGVRRALGAELQFQLKGAPKTFENIERVLADNKNKPLLAIAYESAFEASRDKEDAIARAREAMSLAESAYESFIADELKVAAEKPEAAPKATSESAQGARMTDAEVRIDIRKLPPLRGDALLKWLVDRVDPNLVLRARPGARTVDGSTSLLGVGTSGFVIAVSDPAFPGRDLVLKVGKGRLSVSVDAAMIGAVAQKNGPNRFLPTARAVYRVQDGAYRRTGFAELLAMPEVSGIDLTRMEELSEIPRPMRADAILEDEIPGVAPDKAYKEGRFNDDELWAMADAFVRGLSDMNLEANDMRLDNFMFVEEAGEKRLAFPDAGGVWRIFSEDFDVERRKAGIYYIVTGKKRPGTEKYFTAGARMAFEKEKERAFKFLKKDVEPVNAARGFYDLNSMEDLYANFERLETNLVLFGEAEAEEKRGLAAAILLDLLLLERGVTSRANVKLWVGKGRNTPTLSEATEKILPTLPALSALAPASGSLLERTRTAREIFEKRLRAELGIEPGEAFLRNASAVPYGEMRYQNRYAVETLGAARAAAAYVNSVIETHREAPLVGDAKDPDIEEIRFFMKENSPIQITSNMGTVRIGDVSVVDAVLKRLKVALNRYVMGDRDADYRRLMNRVEGTEYGDRLSAERLRLASDLNMAIAEWEDIQKQWMQVTRTGYLQMIPRSMLLDVKESLAAEDRRIDKKRDELAGILLRFNAFADRADLQVVETKLRDLRRALLNQQEEREGYVSRLRSEIEAEIRKSTPGAVNLEAERAFVTGRFDDVTFRAYSEAIPLRFVAVTAEIDAKIAEVRAALEGLSGARVANPTADAVTRVSSILENGLLGPLGAERIGVVLEGSSDRKRMDADRYAELGMGAEVVARTFEEIPAEEPAAREARIAREAANMTRALLAGAEAKSPATILAERDFPVLEEELAAHSAEVLNGRLAAGAIFLLRTSESSLDLRKKADGLDSPTGSTTQILGFLDRVPGEIEAVFVPSAYFQAIQSGVPPAFRDRIVEVPGTVDARTLDAYAPEGLLAPDWSGPVQERIAGYLKNNAGRQTFMTHGTAFRGFDAPAGARMAEVPSVFDRLLKDYRRHVASGDRTAARKAAEQIVSRVPDFLRIDKGQSLTDMLERAEVYWAVGRAPVLTPALETQRSERELFEYLTSAYLREARPLLSDRTTGPQRAELLRVTYELASLLGVDAAPNKLDILEKTLGGATPPERPLARIQPAVEPPIEPGQTTLLRVRSGAEVNVYNAARPFEPIWRIVAYDDQDGVIVVDAKKDDARHAVVPKQFPRGASFVENGVFFSRDLDGKIGITPLVKEEFGFGGKGYERLRALEKERERELGDAFYIGDRKVEIGVESDGILIERRKIPFTFAGALTFGRTKKNDVVIGGQSVSSRQFTLLAMGDGTFWLNAEGSNETSMDAETFRNDRWIPLRPSAEKVRKAAAAERKLREEAERKVVEAAIAEANGFVLDGPQIYALFPQDEGLGARQIHAITDSRGAIRRFSVEAPAVAADEYAVVLTVTLSSRGTGVVPAFGLVPAPNRPQIERVIAASIEALGALQRRQDEFRRIPKKDAAAVSEFNTEDPEQIYEFDLRGRGKTAEIRFGSSRVAFYRDEDGWKASLLDETTDDSSAGEDSRPRITLPSTIDPSKPLIVGREGFFAGLFAKAIDNTRLSRSHAEVWLIDNKVFVRDGYVDKARGIRASSTNGTGPAVFRPQIAPRGAATQTERSLAANFGSLFSKYAEPLARGGLAYDDISARAYRARSADAIDVMRVYLETLGADAEVQKALEVVTNPDSDYGTFNGASERLRVFFKYFDVTFFVHKSGSGYGSVLLGTVEQYLPVSAIGDPALAAAFPQFERAVFVQPFHPWGTNMLGGFQGGRTLVDEVYVLHDKWVKRDTPLAISVAEHEMHHNFQTLFGDIARMEPWETEYSSYLVQSANLPDNEGDAKQIIDFLFGEVAELAIQGARDAVAEKNRKRAPARADQTFGTRMMEEHQGGGHRILRDLIESGLLDGRPRPYTVKEGIKLRERLLNRGNRDSIPIPKIREAARELLRRFYTQTNKNTGAPRFAQGDRYAYVKFDASKIVNTPPLLPVPAKVVAKLDANVFRVAGVVEFSVRRVERTVDAATGRRAEVIELISPDGQRLSFPERANDPNAAMVSFFEVQVGRPLRTGRATTGAFAANGISKNHFEIALEGGNYVFRDVGSTNGTQVTRPGQQRTALQDGQRLFMAPSGARMSAEALAREAVDRESAEEQEPRPVADVLREFAVEIASAELRHPFGLYAQAFRTYSAKALRVLKYGSESVAVELESGDILRIFNSDEEVEHESFEPSIIERGKLPVSTAAGRQMISYHVERGIQPLAVVEPLAVDNYLRGFGYRLADLAATQKIGLSGGRIVVAPDAAVPLTEDGDVEYDTADIPPLTPRNLSAWLPKKDAYVKDAARAQAIIDAIARADGGDVSLVDSGATWDTFELKSQPDLVFKITKLSPGLTDSRFFFEAQAAEMGRLAKGEKALTKQIGGFDLLSIPGFAPFVYAEGFSSEADRPVGLLIQQKGSYAADRELDRARTAAESSGVQGGPLRASDVKLVGGRAVVADFDRVIYSGARMSDAAQRVEIRTFAAGYLEGRPDAEVMRKLVDAYLAFENPRRDAIYNISIAYYDGINRIPADAETKAQFEALLAILETDVKPRAEAVKYKERRINFIANTLGPLFTAFDGREATAPEAAPQKAIETLDKEFRAGIADWLTSNGAPFDVDVARWNAASATADPSLAPEIREELADLKLAKDVLAAKTAEGDPRETFSAALRFARVAQGAYQTLLGKAGRRGLVADTARYGGTGELFGILRLDFGGDEIRRLAVQHSDAAAPDAMRVLILSEILDTLETLDPQAIADDLGLTGGLNVSAFLSDKRGAGDALYRAYTALVTLGKDDAGRPFTFGDMSPEAKTFVRQSFGRHFRAALEESVLGKKGAIGQEGLARIAVIDVPRRARLEAVSAGARMADSIDWVGPFPASVKPEKRDAVAAALVDIANGADVTDFRFLAHALREIGLDLLSADAAAIEPDDIYETFRTILARAAAGKLGAGTMSNARNYIHHFDAIAPALARLAYELWTDTDQGAVGGLKGGLIGSILRAKPDTTFSDVGTLPKMNQLDTGNLDSPLLPFRALNVLAADSSVQTMFAVNESFERALVDVLTRLAGLDAERLTEATFRDRFAEEAARPIAELDGRTFNTIYAETLVELDERARRMLEQPVSLDFAFPFEADAPLAANIDRVINERYGNFAQTKLHKRYIMSQLDALGEREVSAPKTAERPYGPAADLVLESLEKYWREMGRLYSRELPGWGALREIPLRDALPFIILSGELRPKSSDGIVSHELVRMFGLERESATFVRYARARAAAGAEPPADFLSGRALAGLASGARMAITFKGVETGGVLDKEGRAIFESVLARAVYLTGWDNFELFSRTLDRMFDAEGRPLLSLDEIKNASDDFLIEKLREGIAGQIDDYGAYARSSQLFQFEGDSNRFINPYVGSEALAILRALTSLASYSDSAGRSPRTPAEIAAVLEALRIGRVEEGLKTIKDDASYRARVRVLDPTLVYAGFIKAGGFGDVVKVYKNGKPHALKLPGGAYMTGLYTEADRRNAATGIQETVAFAETIMKGGEKTAELRKFLPVLVEAFGADWKEGDTKDPAILMEFIDFDAIPEAEKWIFGGATPQERLDRLRQTAEKFRELQSLMIASTGQYIFDDRISNFNVEVEKDPSGREAIKRLILLDFGLTRPYVAPEQATDDNLATTLPINPFSKTSLMARASRVRRAVPEGVLSADQAAEKLSQTDPVLLESLGDFELFPQNERATLVKNADWTPVIAAEWLSREIELLQFFPTERFEHDLGEMISSKAENAIKYLLTLRPAKDGNGKNKRASVTLRELDLRIDAVDGKQVIYAKGLEIGSLSDTAYVPNVANLVAALGSLDNKPAGARMADEDFSGKVKNAFTSARQALSSEGHLDAQAAEILDFLESRYAGEDFKAARAAQARLSDLVSAEQGTGRRDALKAALGLVAPILGLFATDISARIARRKKEYAAALDVSALPAADFSAYSFTGKTEESAYRFFVATPVSGGPIDILKIGEVRREAIFLDRVRREFPSVAPFIPVFKGYGVLTDVDAMRLGDPTMKGRPYMITSRAEGKRFELTLFELSKGSIGEDEALGAHLAAARAIARLHAAGIAHRDLKDREVFVNPVTGRATIVDFGISAILGDATRGEEDLVKGELHQIGTSVSGRGKGSLNRDVRALVSLLEQIVFAANQSAGRDGRESLIRRLALEEFGLQAKKALVLAQENDAAPAYGIGELLADLEKLYASFKAAEIARAARMADPNGTPVTPDSLRASVGALRTAPDPAAWKTAAEDLAARVTAATPEALDLKLYERSPAVDEALSALLDAYRDARSGRELRNTIRAALYSALGRNHTLAPLYIEALDRLYVDKEDADDEQTKARLEEVYARLGVVVEGHSEIYARIQEFETVYSATAVAVTALKGVEWEKARDLYGLPGEPGDYELLGLRARYYLGLANNSLNRRAILNKPGDSEKARVMTQLVQEFRAKVRDSEKEHERELPEEGEAPVELTLRFIGDIQAIAAVYSRLVELLLRADAEKAEELPRLQSGLYSGDAEAARHLLWLSKFGSAPAIAALRFAGAPTKTAEVEWAQTNRELDERLDISGARVADPKELLAVAADKSKPIDERKHALTTLAEVGQAAAVVVTQIEAIRIDPTEDNALRGLAYLAIRSYEVAVEKTVPEVPGPAAPVRLDDPDRRNAALARWEGKSISRVNFLNDPRNTAVVYRMANRAGKERNLHLGWAFEVDDGVHKPITEPELRNPAAIEAVNAVFVEAFRETVQAYDWQDVRWSLVVEGSSGFGLEAGASLGIRASSVNEVLPLLQALQSGDEARIRRNAAFFTASLAHEFAHNHRDEAAGFSMAREREVVSQMAQFLFNPAENAIFNESVAADLDKLRVPVAGRSPKEAFNYEYYEAMRIALVLVADLALSSRGEFPEIAAEADRLKEGDELDALKVFAASFEKLPRDRAAAIFRSAMDAFLPLNQKALRERYPESRDRVFASSGARLAAADSASSAQADAPADRPAPASAIEALAAGETGAARAGGRGRETTFAAASPAERFLEKAGITLPANPPNAERVRESAAAESGFLSRIRWASGMLVPYAFAEQAAVVRQNGARLAVSAPDGTPIADVEMQSARPAAVPTLAAQPKSIPDYLREFDGATTRVEEAMLLAFGAEGLETLTAEPRSIAIDIGVLPAKRPEYLENLFVQLLAMRARPVAANVSFRLTGPGVQEALASSDLARQLVRKGIIDQTPDPKLKTAEIAGINRIESLSGETYLPFRAVEITDKEAGVPKWQAMILLAVMASEIGKKTEDPVLLRQFYEAYRDVSGLSVEKLEPAKLLEALKAFLTGTASKSLAEDYAMRAAPIDINRIIQLFSNIKRIVASAA